MNAIDALSSRGGHRVQQHAPLGARTTYRVGGSVRLFVTFSSLAELEELGPFLRGADLEIVSIGNGSNLLVADGEHDVVAVHVAGELAQLSWRDEAGHVIVDAGAGLDLPVAARRLAHEGVVGFEWAVGVPGTFGGAVAMNAGGHGSDIAASIKHAVIWRDGALVTWSRDELRLGYRTSALLRGDVVVSCTLQLDRGDPREADARVREIVRWRRENQPGGANGGSVFQNPPRQYAAQLIEAAGAKGLRQGSAQVSEKHANFIQADPDGRANDVFALITEIQSRVHDHSGVTLVSEHRFIGFTSSP